MDCNYICMFWSLGDIVLRFFVTCLVFVIAMVVIELFTQLGSIFFRLGAILVFSLILRSYGKYLFIVT